MNNPRASNFRPRWYSSSSREEIQELEAEPCIGSQPLAFPRITARVLSSNHATSLPASALVEILEQTQKLARFAAYDVTRGMNPDFADLRTLGPELTQFSNLTIEPFEEGSFVIPARLEASPIESVGRENATVSADDITNRFREIFSNLSNWKSATNVSIGALQSVDSLRRVLQRVGAQVEYITSNSLSVSQHFATDEEYWGHVSSWLRHRRPRSQELETLEGRVTSLDILDGRLLLSVNSSHERISGTFPTMLHPKLLDSLGQRVRVFGLIGYRGGRPTSINIQDSEFLDDA